MAAELQRGIALRRAGQPSVRRRAMLPPSCHPARRTRSEDRNATKGHRSQSRVESPSMARHMSCRVRASNGSRAVWPARSSIPKGLASEESEVTRPRSRRLLRPEPLPELPVPHRPCHTPSEERCPSQHDHRRKVLWSRHRHHVCTPVLSTCEGR